MLDALATAVANQNRPTQRLLLLSAAFAVVVLLVLLVFLACTGWGWQLEKRVAMAITNRLSTAGPTTAGGGT